MTQLKYAHVTGWAANAIKFSLRILIARGKTQRLNFATPDGKRITATTEQTVATSTIRDKAKAAAAAAAAIAAATARQ